MIALGLALLSGGLCLLISGLLLHGVWTRLNLTVERRRQQPLSLVVSARQDLADGLFSLRLRSAGRRRLPRFLAGQYLALLAPAGANGALARRCYSLAAWQPHPREYELCIKREDEGLVSRFLHASLQPGSVITSMPPTGPFHLRAPATPAVVLMAGGVGITPMRAMLHALLSRYPGTRVWLYHAAREPSGLAYADEFREMELQHAQFTYHPIVSQPPRDWTEARGRLDAARLLSGLGKVEATFYQCASAGFMSTMRAGLVAAGISDTSIHEEAFGIAAEGADPQTIWLEGQAHAYLGEPSLLLALAAQGVNIESECRTGHCGSCRMRLCEGQVRWQAEAGCDVADDEILACLCVPVSPVRLERQQLRKLKPANS